MIIPVMCATILVQLYHEIYESHKLTVKKN